MYAKNGLQNDIFEKLFDQSTLVSHQFGPNTLKTLTKRGDYLKFMYGSTYNGDTFTTIINDLGDFIEYYSHELAKTDIVIPNYDHFTKNKAPVASWFDGHGNVVYCPYKSKNYIVNYGVFPELELEQRILAYESLLTWICMMSLTLAYMENDANDIQGLHGAQTKVQEFLNSPATKSVVEWHANL